MTSRRRPWNLYGIAPIRPAADPKPPPAEFEDAAAVAEPDIAWIETDAGDMQKWIPAPPRSCTRRMAITRELTPDPAHRIPTLEAAFVGRLHGSAPPLTASLQMSLPGGNGCEAFAAKGIP